MSKFKLGDPVRYRAGDDWWRGILCEPPANRTASLGRTGWGWWLTEGRNAGMAEWVYAPSYTQLEPDPEGDALLARFTAWRLTQ